MSGVPLLDAPSGNAELEAKATAKRFDWRFLTVCAIFTTLCTLVVGLAVVLVSVEVIPTLMTIFHTCHLVMACVICGGGSWFVLRATKKVFSDADAAMRKSSWSASVSVVLLALAALSDVVGCIIQVVGRTPAVGWFSVAEDIFTIPESLAMAAVLITLELNSNLVQHYRRMKLAILPCIAALSLAFILFNIAGVNTWNDTSDDLGQLKE